jgi:Fe-S oxidoreductase
VCPIEPTLPIRNRDPEHLTKGVIQILRRGEPEPDAAAWVQACAGSGDCIKACPENINPRQMISLAKHVMNAQNGGGPYATYWHTMGRLTRTLAGMQLTPEERRKVASASGKRQAKIGFWVGCNIPRTSHMVLLIVDILEKLGVDCEVLGGMNNCCGIIHFWQGDSATGEQIVRNLGKNMQAMRPDLILSWCPSCQIQHDEFLGGFLNLGFPVRHLTTFLVEQAHLLRSHIVKALPMRVAIHEHSGLDGAMENIRELLQLIPGITIVPVEQIGNYGYMCSRLDQAPVAKADMHRTVLESAKVAGVDVLITVYHSCHRDLSAHEDRYPFAVRNFLDVLGEAMGLYREDKYKKYQRLADPEAIIEDARPFIEMNRLNLEDVRFVINKAFVRTSAPETKTP